MFYLLVYYICEQKLYKLGSGIAHVRKPWTPQMSWAAYGPDMYTGFQVHCPKWYRACASNCQCYSSCSWNAFVFSGESPLGSWVALLQYTLTDTLCYLPIDESKYSQPNAHVQPSLEKRTTTVLKSGVYVREFWAVTFVKANGRVGAIPTYRVYRLYDKQYLHHSFTDYTCIHMVVHIAYSWLCVYRYRQLHVGVYNWSMRFSLLRLTVHLRTIYK